MKPKEAFEILRDTPIDIRSAREDDIHSLYATAQNMALDALERQMWIPCSERLPKINECVLVSDVAGYVQVAELYRNKKGKLKWESDIGLDLDCEVIAWMPLPEPYKEGDTDG